MSYLKSHSFGPKTNQTFQKMFDSSLNIFRRDYDTATAFERGRERQRESLWDMKNKIGSRQAKWRA